MSAYNLHRQHPLTGCRVYVPRLWSVGPGGETPQVRVADWWPRLIGEPLECVLPWDPRMAAVDIEIDYVRRFAGSALNLLPPVAVRLGRTMEHTELVHHEEILGALDEPTGRRSGVSLWLCSCSAGYVDAGRPCPRCGGRGRRVTAATMSVLASAIDEWGPRQQ